MSINATTYNSILSKGIESELPNNIGMDKLRFTTDTGRLFLDNNGTDRIEFTDFVKGLTKLQILGTLNPLPKVYLSSDTHEMLIYDNTSHEWVNYGGRLEVIELTQAQYDQLTPEEKADPNKIYAVPGNGNYLKFQEISAEDYNALSEQQKMDPYTVYMTPGDGTYFRIVDITQEEYDELTPEEKADPQILYLIPEEDKTPKIKIIDCIEDTQVIGSNTQITSEVSLFDMMNLVEAGYDISLRYIHEEYNNDNLVCRRIRMLKLQEYNHDFDTTGESNDDIKLIFTVQTSTGLDKYIMESSDGNDTYILNLDI